MFWAEVIPKSAAINPKLVFSSPMPIHLFPP